MSLDAFFGILLNVCAKAKKTSWMHDVWLDTIVVDYKYVRKFAIVIIKH